jgi:hypothetical protein
VREQRDADERAARNGWLRITDTSGDHVGPGEARWRA